MWVARLAALALAVCAAEAQLDLGGSLESSKCSFATFQGRVRAVEQACCTTAGSCQNGAAPTECSIKCATVYVPFWTECSEILNLVLGQSHGHGRRLQGTALPGGSGAGAVRSARSCKELGWDAGGQGQAQRLDKIIVAALNNGG